HNSSHIGADKRFSFSTERRCHQYDRLLVPVAYILQVGTNGSELFRYDTAAVVFYDQRIAVLGMSYLPQYRRRRILLQIHLIPHLILQGLSGGDHTDRDEDADDEIKRI